MTTRLPKCGRVHTFHELAKRSSRHILPPCFKLLKGLKSFKFKSKPTQLTRRGLLLCSTCSRVRLCVRTCSPDEPHLRQCVAFVCTPFAIEAVVLKAGTRRLSRRLSRRLFRRRPSTPCTQYHTNHSHIFNDNLFTPQVRFGPFQRRSPIPKNSDPEAFPIQAISLLTSEPFNLNVLRESLKNH